MKILLINKFFFPYGGSETAFFHTAEMLRGAGHEVVFFSMEHPRNLPSPQARHFAPRVDFEECRGPGQRLRGLRRLLFGHRVPERLEALLREERPDVAHLHNIYHHLSAWMIPVLQRQGVPVVLTLHDYKPVCPAFKLFRRGRVCERCRGRRFYRCLFGDCLKHSRWKSMLAAVEMTLQGALYERVDAFIAPSRFVQEKVRDMGLNGRFFLIPNSVPAAADPAPAPPDPPRILCFGRLVEEKGVAVLVEAMAGVAAECLVVGDGPLRPHLERLAESRAPGRVRFLGFQPRAALPEIIRSSSLVVVPSVWYENNPYSVLESFAQGVAVVGARIGGIPELVRDGETGATFVPGDSADLGRQLRRLLDRPTELRVMGETARAWMAKEFTPAGHLEKLLACYRTVT